MILKRFLLSLFALICSNTQAQQLEFGLGTTTNTLYSFGYNIHAFAGAKISNGFTLGIKLDYHILPRRGEFFQMYLDYGDWNNPRVNADTHYNVKQQNYYSIFSVSLEPRFYSKKEREYKSYLAPTFGIGLFKEQVIFSSNTFNKENVYYNFKPSIGYERGIEFPLSADKKTSLQIAFNLKVYLGFRTTDIYFSRFSSNTNLFLNARVALVKGGR